MNNHRHRIIVVRIGIDKGLLLEWLDGRLTSPLLVLYGNVQRTDRHLLEPACKSI
jgi:hypothetical protein